MEPRQPDESNPDATTPPVGPIADNRLSDTQVSELGTVPPPDNQEAGNRQNTTQRDNRTDGPRTDGPRTDEPRTDASRDGRPQQQRENRPQNNRNSRNDVAGQRGNHRNGEPRSDGQQRDNRQPATGQRPVENRQRDSSAPDRERNSTSRNQPREPMVPESGLRDVGNQNDSPAEQGGREDRLVIGISLGDYNGIGPEVILKALQYNRLQKICTPVIYGSMRILNRYRNLLDLKDWNLNGAQTIGQISHKLTNVITCWPDQNQDIQPGQVTPEAGQAALSCLQRAVDDLKDGKLDALVTAPINKYNIQSEEFTFPGHTEYLAQEFGVPDNLMFMVSETLRVGVVTGHVPLGRVRQNITRERIAQKLMLMMQSLKQDFGIEKPKIAVLGLNPHAGEEGLLGNEENDIIKPLIADWNNKGEMVFGPYPADGFFGTRAYKKFDAVLAMYHDQGLIPFKAIAFEEGVNFTAGMPAVRTSPDHGTAYDIAGKNLADETSMLQAIYTAIDVARHRKEFLELEAGALK
ncbi:4-hydroxythreonine-4-phosphate dehydrogenase PdxA [Spirosoma areae]